MTVRFGCEEIEISGSSISDADFEGDNGGTCTWDFQPKMRHLMSGRVLVRNESRWAGRTSLKCDDSFGVNEEPFRSPQTHDGLLVYDNTAHRRGTASVAHSSSTASWSKPHRTDTGLGATCWARKGINYTAGNAPSRDADALAATPHSRNKRKVAVPANARGHKRGGAERMSGRSHKCSTGGWFARSPEVFAN